MQQPVWRGKGTLLRCAVALGLLAVLGCGNRVVYPVRGQLVFPDGSPVTGMDNGIIEFEPVEGERKLGARGTIDEEGRFEMSTEGNNDGAALGRHKVLICPTRNHPSTVAEKYRRFETSGLEVTIEPKTNDLTLIVEPIKPRGQQLSPAEKESRDLRKGERGSPKRN